MRFETCSTTNSKLETWENMYVIWEISYEKVGVVFWRFWFLNKIFFSVIVNHATTQGPFHTSTCPQCPTKFKNYSEYKKHLEDIHCDQKICGSCGNFFPTEEVLKNHMISAHKGVKFTRKGTEKKGKYNPHKKVVCDLCGKPFAGSLYTHKMKVCGTLCRLCKT